MQESSALDRVSRKLICVGAECWRRPGVVGTLEALEAGVGLVLQESAFRFRVGTEQRFCSRLQSRGQLEAGLLWGFGGVCCGVLGVGSRIWGVGFKIRC